MSHSVYFENTLLSHINCADLESLKQKISEECCIPAQDLLITANGKILSCDTDLQADNVVRVYLSLSGKPDFDSLSQNTTNRESYRLRDKEMRRTKRIEENRKKEVAERKQKKIERLTAKANGNEASNPICEEDCPQLPSLTNATMAVARQVAETSGIARIPREVEEDIEEVKRKAKLWFEREFPDYVWSPSDDEVFL